MKNEMKLDETKILPWLQTLAARVPPPSQLDLQLHVWVFGVALSVTKEQRRKAVAGRKKSNARGRIGARIPARDREIWSTRRLLEAATGNPKSFITRAELTELRA
jgi:hypothetical protein